MSYPASPEPEPADKVVRRLAAVVSADVVGYSRLIERDEEGTVCRLKGYFQNVVRTAVTVHGGRIVKLMGDGALVEFPSVVEAVRCSLRIQEEVTAAEAQRPLDDQIRYRVGIHLGDVIIDGDDIQGHGVNVSARLEGLAEPGGICLSDAVRTSLGSLHLNYDDLGPQDVKNIAEPVRAFRIRPGAPAPTRLARKLGRTAPLLPVLAAIVMLLAIVGAFLGFEPTRWLDLNDDESASADNTPSIAVLPFLNISDDEAQEFFVDGLTEDLIIDLSNVIGLFVISRNSSFTYKNQTVRPQQVAHDLGVDYVLNGSVRRSADQVRITAQLVDTSNDRQIWAARYDRELKDIFAVQDEVKQQIIAALSIKLTPSEKNNGSAAPTQNIEAYEYYLRGRYAMNLLTRRALRLAYYAFERAIALDPDFAEAHAALAMTYATDLTGTHVWNDWVRSPGRSRPQAEVLADRADALDPNLAVPELVRARLSLAEWRYDDAIAHARRAVEREPGNADSHATLALVLTAAGQHTEAKQAIDEALRRDPKAVASTLGTHGIIQFALRDYRAARDSFGLSYKQMVDGGNWLFGSFDLATAAYAGDGSDVQYAREHNYWSVSLSAIRFTQFYRSADDMEHLLEGLRMAGVPEWDPGFDPEKEAAELVIGAELKRLLDGRNFDTLCSNPRLNGQIRFGASGSVTWTLRHDLTDTGVSRIDVGSVCVKLPVITRGREACYSVFEVGADSHLVRGYPYALAGPTLCYFREKG